MTNRRISRQVTDKLWADLDDGLIDPFNFARACLNWMSEDEVREMAEENGFLEEEVTVHRYMAWDGMELEVWCD